MAGSSLLTLIDDIATLLDDVAVLSKVAAKKTAGVLGDDLALNAEQVSGVRAERELPVVWAVAKGSFKNKFILVPGALIISAVLPAAIIVLLVIGGLYLCFEGFEKVAHKFLHSEGDLEQEHRQKLEQLSDPEVDLVSFEQEKIKGAIRTDFILSAEIIVIMLGTVQEAPFETQVAVLSSMAILFTVGVYGFVAGIVKLDDAGLYLLQQSQTGDGNGLQAALGRGLLIVAPALMKTLSVVGTIAMFLVGGGIIVHHIAFVHHLLEPILHPFADGSAMAWANSILPIVLEGLVGLIAGGLVLGIVSLGQKLFKK